MIDPDFLWIFLKGASYVLNIDTITPLVLNKSQNKGNNGKKKLILSSGFRLDLNKNENRDESTALGN